jgi:hypothetical protein
MEIISPFNPDDASASQGNFGNDGFILPTVGSVRCLNASDNWKITFSPMVVSWDGRLISVQVFVNPTLIPNAMDWQILAPEFRIPIVVQIGGNISNVDTFYIVQPWTLGNVSGNAERVLGEGTLGRRSRRGAMLVDSLMLANSTYTVSTLDCDPGTAGNQGYLPFTLMAKGKIAGLANTIISVNGEKAVAGHAGHGGPGGGGGGGRFCDVFSGTGGDNAGNGYISGGRGGWNNSIGGGGGNRPYGEGSGNAGASLNSVYPPKTAGGNFEASGGATGHPFGIPGICTYDGNSDNPLGGFGGGSSFTQKRNGGSGGYATKGMNSLGRNSLNQLSQSGGSAHGNSMGVPLAGGSGGASGNPNSINDCSGSGGGGGGAILIYAPLISNVSLYSYGADGSNGTGTDATVTRGGSGSGGFTGIATKLTLNTLNLQVQGGKDADGDVSGGAGRMRFDIPQWNNDNTNIPANASKFRGPTTDTTKFVKRTFTLNGSKGNDKILYAYIKPESGSWKQLSTISTPGNSWTLPIDLSSVADCNDSIYYFVIFQEESKTGSIATHNFTPEYVMSNAATNIFRIIPDIQGDVQANTRITICDKKEKDTLTFKIKNVGGPTLNLFIKDSSYFELKANGLNYKGFRLIEPNPATNANKLLASCDSTEFKVEYTYQPSHSGTVSTKLFIPHNDIDPNRKRPWEVDLTVTIDSFAIASYNTSNVKLNITNNILDLGDVCLGDTLESNFKIKNISSFPVNLKNFTISGDNINFSSSWIDTNFIEIGDEIRAFVRFENPTEVRQYRSRIYIKPQECDFAIDSFDVVANVVQNDIKFSLSSVFVDTVHFGKVKIGYSKTVTVEVRNEGSGPAWITQVYVSGGDYRLNGVNPSLPILIDGMSSTKLDANIEFTPVTEGEQTGILTVVSDKHKNPNACSGRADVILFGEGLRSEVTAYPLNYGKVAECQGIVVDSIEVKNTGQATIKIISVGKIIGQNANYFSLRNPKSAPYNLSPNQTVFYQVLLDPSIPFIGTKSATFHLVSDDALEPDIYAKITADIDSVYLRVTPRNISFGGVPVPQTLSSQIEISNEGNFNVRINRVEITDPLVTTTPNINGTTLYPGDKIILDVNVNFSEYREIDAFVHVITNLPCIDTQSVRVTGVGLEGEWTYNSFLDFATIAFCETSSRTFTLTNIGDPVIVFKSMRILQEDDWQFFHLQGPEPNNEVLNKGDFYRREILFKPDFSNDGIKTAKLEFTIFVNSADKTSILQMQGERNSGLLSLPNLVNFGDVSVSMSSSKELKLANIGKIPITINRIKPLLVHADVFSTIPAQLAGDVTLNPGDTLKLTARFAPLNLVEYIDTLELEISSPCSEIKRIALQGNGVHAFDARVWIPNMTVHPKTKNLKIPVYLQITETGKSFDDISVTGKIHFNETVFLPMSLSNNAVLLNNYKDGNGQRVIEFSASNLDINDNDLLLFDIVGDAMLGEVKETELYWDNFNLSSQFVFKPINPENGILSLLICEEGGERLLTNGSPTTLFATPNPVSSALSINGNTLEAGMHSLEIVNVQGMKTKLREWNADETDNFDFSIDLSGYSSGMYYIILHTPNRTFTKAVFVIN